MNRYLIYFLLATISVFTISCADDSNEQIIDGDVDRETDTDSEGEDSEVGFQKYVIHKDGCDIGIGLDAHSSPAPLFDFGAKDIFKAPYPNNYWVSDAGYIELPNYPNPKNSSLIDSYIELAETELQGFSTNAPVFWTFSEAVDLSSLIENIEDSVKFDSPILLLNIDPDSKDYSKLMPISWHYINKSSSYEPAHLLSVAVADGFPLRASTTYAMILTDKVKTVANGAIGRNQTLVDLLSGCEQGKLYDAYSPLRNFLIENASTFNPDIIRAATVFTTSDSVKELRNIRNYIANEYPNGDITGELIDCEMVRNPNNINTWWFEGHYSSPNFQTGDTPYATTGGDILFDENGDPIVQRMEELRFALSIPKDMDMPENGWPIVMIAHGTGGDYTSFVRGNRMRKLQEVGLAAIGIDQPLHGPRGGDLSDESLELYSFNFMNPKAGRNGFRQSAIDTFALTQFIASGKLVMDRTVCSSWPSQYDGPDKIIFDADKISFHGHSHGGISGALAAAVEDDVKAWVLSGAGGRMSITIMERKNPSILELIEFAIGVPADELHLNHPLISVVQMLVDLTDPINYAPFWIDTPYNGVPRNIMATTGFKDPYTPKPSAAAMAVAGRLPLVKPVAEEILGLTIRGIDSIKRPVSRNIVVTGGKYSTAGFFQYPNAGHFPIFDDDDAIKLYQEFLRSNAYDETTVLGY